MCVQVCHHPRYLYRRLRSIRHIVVQYTRIYVFGWSRLLQVCYCSGFFQMHAVTTVVSIAFVIFIFFFISFCIAHASATELHVFAELKFAYTHFYTTHRVHSSRYVRSLTVREYYLIDFKPIGNANAQSSSLWIWLARVAFPILFFCTFFFAIYACEYRLEFVFLFSAILNCSQCFRFRLNNFAKKKKHTYS